MSNRYSLLQQLNSLPPSLKLHPHLNIFYLFPSSSLLFSSPTKPYTPLKPKNLFLFNSPSILACYISNQRPLRALACYPNTIFITSFVFQKSRGMCMNPSFSKLGVSSIELNSCLLWWLWACLYSIELVYYMIACSISIFMLMNFWLWIGLVDWLVHSCVWLLCWWWMISCDHCDVNCMIWAPILHG